MCHYLNMAGKVCAGIVMDPGGAAGAIYVGPVVWATRADLGLQGAPAW
jgi:hypothetical protein